MLTELGSCFWFFFFDNLIEKKTSRLKPEINVTDTMNCLFMSKQYADTKRTFYLYILNHCIGLQQNVSHMLRSNICIKRDFSVHVKKVQKHVKRVCVKTCIHKHLFHLSHMCYMYNYVRYSYVVFHHICYMHYITHAIQV